MNMLKLIGLILFPLFLSISLIHVYWGLGGKWGSKAVLPTTESNKTLFKPGLFACLLVSASLLSLAILVLLKSNLLSFKVPAFIDQYGLPGSIAIFALRTLGDFKFVGLSRQVKNTNFALMDKKYYTPLCLLIAILLTAIQFIK